MKKLLLIICLLGNLTDVKAENRKDTIEVINIKSLINGGLYQLYIRTPLNYDDEQKHPAILLLDANYYHRTFVNIYDSIVSSENDNQIIIGIGYLPNPMNDTLYLRDFTPNHINNFPNSGKAEVFKQILEEELIPAIIENYNVDESKISIVGHHYSALFLTWLLTQELPRFSNYVICSPVLTFNKDFTDFKTDNTGIYLSLGSGKIRFLENPEANKEKFNALLKWLKNHSTSNLFKSSYFQSILRYDDLHQGFYGGINYILNNTETKGNWNSNSTVDEKTILSRSHVIVDQVLDSNTSYPYEIATLIPPNTLEENLPVIVVLDADFNYTELLYAYQQSMNEGSVAPSIIVGIGYGTSIIGRGNYRNRDFLPFKIKNLESGNGNNFATFLNKQLITYLSQYPIDKNTMTLQGHSYGGLFLTYLLTRDSLAYQNLIISSPAIWQDKSVLKKLKKLNAKISQNIFLASGQLNDNDKDTKQLDKVLSNKTANLRTVLYPNDSHLTVISSAFKDALIFLNE